MTTLTKTETTAEEYWRRLTTHKGRIPHQDHDGLDEAEMAEMVAGLMAIKSRKTHDSAPFAVVRVGKNYEVEIPPAYPPNVKGHVRSCGERKVAKLKQIDRMREKLAKKKAVSGK